MRTMHQPNMKPRLLLPALWAASQLVASAQVGVGTTTPDASAQLDVTSTTLGFLPPRMTQAQRLDIATPAAGLLVYQTDGTAGLYCYVGGVWSTFSGMESALTFSAPLSRSDNTITLATASDTQTGALTATDWSLFNAKENALTFSAPFSRSTNTLSLPAADASSNGYLAAADWTRFNTACGWGDHATAGYLTSYSETDPIFGASAAHDIAAGDITAWSAKLDGSGTASYVPMFSATGTLGDSAIVSAADGKVGIGTATPAYKLDVAGAINATTAITIGGVPVATSRDTYWSIVGSGPDIQYSGAKVGVNTATPAYTLDVGGDINVTGGSFRINGVPLTGTGTVTSVAGSGGTTGLSVSGGPITTAGTLTLGGTLAVASGGTGATTTAAARTNLGLGTAATLAAASTNTLSAVVQRDASGNFSAGTITAALTGTASKAGNLVGGNSTTLLGAIGYQSNTDATTLLAPNTTATKKFLRMTGTGSNGAAPAWDTLVAADIPTLNQSSTGTAANVTGTVAVANGGTGATTAALARTSLSAAASGANGDITSLTGLATALSVAQGGTGASTLTGLLRGTGTTAVTGGSTVALTSEVTGMLPIANGGTAATTAAAARTNLGLGSAATLAAASTNTLSAVVQRDASGNFSAGTITATLTGTASTATSLVGGNTTTLLGALGYQSAANVTTLLAPNTTATKKFLSMTGTGVNGAAPVWDTFSGAAAGANSDITSLSGLTTDITVAQGGTGASTLTANKVLVGNGASTPLQPTNLHWDNTNSRLGVGDTTPSYTVDVTGDVNVTGAFRVNGTAVATTLDYAMAAKTTSTPLVAAGTDISGWGTPYLRGAITQYNTTYFKLKAGKTYELECVLKLCTFTGGARYAWVDDSNALVGDVMVLAYVFPVTFANPEASQPVTKAVFTPAVDTYVKVRMTSVSGTVTVEAIGSYVTIKQLQ